MTYSSLVLAPSAISWGLGIVTAAPLSAYFEKQDDGFVKLRLKGTTTWTIIAPNTPVNLVGTIAVANLPSWARPKALNTNVAVGNFNLNPYSPSVAPTTTLIFSDGTTFSIGSSATGGTNGVAAGSRNIDTTIYYQV